MVQEDTFSATLIPEEEASNSTIFCDHPKLKTEVERRTLQRYAVTAVSFATSRPAIDCKNGSAYLIETRRASIRGPSRRCSIFLPKLSLLTNLASLSTTQLGMGTSNNTLTSSGVGSLNQLKPLDLSGNALGSNSDLAQASRSLALEAEACRLIRQRVGTGCRGRRRRISLRSRWARTWIWKEDMH